MMKGIENRSSECTHLRRVRVCLILLARYLWLIVIIAIAAAVIPLLGWPLKAFRVDAVYHILFVHLCGAILITGVLRMTRGATQAPAWSGKVLLGALPLMMGISADRLALLAYPRISADPNAAIYQSHGTRLWTLRPGAETELGVPTKLNERGMRGPVIPYEKAAGERRVVILGDSVAFGLGVNDEDCFDRLATERMATGGLGDVTLVNLSVPGYSPWQHVDVLRTEGMAYDPDVIIYAFCFNDVVDWQWRELLRIRRSPKTHEHLEVSGLFRLARGLANELWRRSMRRAFVLERHAVEPVLRDADTPEVNEAWGVMLEHVAQIVTFAKEHERPVAFLIFPHAWHLHCDSSGAEDPQQRLVAFAEANGVPCLDLLSPFLSECGTPGFQPGDLFIDEWHLTPRGHAATAAALIEFLVAEGLIAK